MKKTILLILALLPIVLIVIIAFAGQILSLYQHISVEKVAFVDRFNNEYTSETTFTVEQGKTKATTIVISPELASNKRVTYTSSDESICTVDKDGVITGVHYGFATVTVKTDDGSKISTLNVEVTAKSPFAVYLYDGNPDINKDAKPLGDSMGILVGETFQLFPVVDAPVAMDKNVSYSSDHPEIVRVDQAGKLTALAEGTATITVTTNLGGCTDTCVVTVEKGTLPIDFDFTGKTEITPKNNGIYEVSIGEIDLLDYLIVGSGINKDEVKFKITQGNNIATLNGSKLTYVSESGLVKILAYTGSEDSPTAQKELKLIFAVKN